MELGVDFMSFVMLTCFIIVRLPTPGNIVIYATEVICMSEICCVVEICTLICVFFCVSVSDVMATIMSLSCQHM
jgi:hypothetical protein